MPFCSRFNMIKTSKEVCKIDSGLKSISKDIRISLISNKFWDYWIQRTSLLKQQSSIRATRENYTISTKDFK